MVTAGCGRDRSGASRAGTRALLAALLLLLCALPSPGQPMGSGDVLVLASLPAGQAMRPESFLAVNVTLQNLGASRTVDLTLRQGGMDLTEPVQVDLPEKASREIQLACPHYTGYMDTIVAVATHRGRVVGEGEAKLLRINGDQDLCVSVLGGNADFRYVATYNDLLNTSSGNMVNININLPDPRALPRHWAGWLPVDVVVVYDLPRLNLTREAQTALADWTRAGGVLVLVSGGDPAEFRGSALASLVPLQTTASEDHAGVTLVTGTLTAGAEVLSEFAGKPLLVHAHRNGGDVFEITAGVRDKDLLGDDITKNDCWQPILKLVFDQVDNRERPDPQFGLEKSGLLRRLPEMGLPSPGLLAWMLLLYVLLVGPVNFALLRRKDRMLGIFLTVPVIALVFTFGAFLTTHFARGTSTVLREVGRVEMLSGRPGARLDCTLSLFSPAPRTYRLEFPPECAGVLQEAPGNGPQEQPPALLGEGLVYPQVRMQMSSLRRLSVRSLPVLPGTITLEPGTDTLAVDNQSGLSLVDCLVVNGDRRSQSFPVAPGRQRVQLAFKNKSSDDEIKYQMVKGGKGEDPLRDDRAKLVEATLKEHGFPRNGQWLLLGWSRELGAGVKIDGAVKHHKDYLVVVELPAPPGTPPSPAPLPESESVVIP